MEDWIAGFIDMCNAAHQPNEKDYIGDDGFWHCGICKEAKERLYAVNNGDITITKRMYRSCRCERERNRAKQEAEQKAEASKRIEGLRRASLMDAKFYEARFENHHETPYNAENMRLCRKYVDRFDEMLKIHQGLLFYGNVGTGKSFAAACIANALMDKGIPAVMTSFVKLLDMADRREDEILRRLESCKVVIFDDLGAERGTDYALERVFDIVDSRDRSNLPMIVTTNLTLKEMHEEVRERQARIYDRILGNCFPVQWTGPSWRKVQAKDRFSRLKSILGVDE